jgi:hypothetical protein
MDTGGSFPRDKAAWELKANCDKNSSAFCLINPLAPEFSFKF